MAVLQRGMQSVGKTKVGGFSAYSPEISSMILDLRNLVDEVFHPQGPMMRNGVTGADIARKLQANKGVAGAFLPQKMAGKPLSDMWTHVDFATLESPIDYLNTVHSAVAQASFRPAVGGSLATLFDHKSPNAMGKSIPQLVSEGWRKIAAPSDPNHLANFIPRDSLFPPEIVKQMPNLEWQIATMEKGLPQRIQQIVRVSDGVSNPWKESVTALNPRHLMTNVLGNTGAALLTGTNPLYFVKAFRIMSELGFGKMPANADALVASLAEDGRNIKTTFMNPVTTLVIDGGKGAKATVTPFSAQQIETAFRQYGAAMDSHRGLDLISQMSTKSIIKKHTPKFLNYFQQAIGDTLSAADNVTRMAVFTHTLEKQSYPSVEAAMQAAGAAVRKSQPTRSSMSPFEKQYATRILMFYSWQKQMLGTIMGVALENPARLTLYSKGQYNIAQSAGLSPDSPGMPLNPNNANLPSYELNSPYGPTFTAGGTPFTPAGSDGQSNLWGLSLSAPQIDSMMTFFGGANDNSKQGPFLGALHNMLGSINPLAANADALVQDVNPSGIGKGPSADYGKFILNSTGLPGTAASIMGLENKAARKSSNPATAAANQAAQNADNTSAQQRALINWITGLKFTNYTSSTAKNFAKSEQGIDASNQLRSLGYSDQQISIIKKIWKAQQAAGPTAPAPVPPGG